MINFAIDNIFSSALDTYCITLMHVNFKKNTYMYVSQIQYLVTELCH